MKLLKKLFGFFWDRSTLIFLIIGGTNFIITTVGSVLLRENLGWSFFWATAFMYVVCSVISFILNRKYSFKSKAPLGPSILKFSVVILVCYLLSYLGQELLVPWMRDAFFPGIPDLWYTLIRVVGLQVIFTVLNYIGQRLWAFKE